MREHAVEDITEKHDEKHSANAAYRVLYDGQCKICQSCVSWLKALDHENNTVCLPISAEVLPTVDARLNLDECLRQLHVVTPEGEIHVGWDAVACLARLFPTTWLIGALGQRFPSQCRTPTIRIRCYKQILPKKSRGGACSVTKPEVVRRQARLGAFWSCYTLGFFIRLPLVLWAGIFAVYLKKNS